MKKVKSLSLLLLCISLIAVMFAGCSKISFEGKWVTTVNLQSMIDEMDMSKDADMGQYYEKFTDEFKIDVFYTFSKDNKFTTSIDEEKFNKDMEALSERYADYFIEGMYKYAEAQGMSKSEFDSYYEKENGAPIREDFLKEVSLSTDFEEIGKAFINSTPQNLIIEKDRFYITDDKGIKTGYETFTYENDTLTIHNQFDMTDTPVEDENLIYPMVLTKVE